MKKVFIIGVIFIFGLFSYGKIFALDTYEIEKALNSFDLGVKKEDSREKLLLVERGGEFANKIDEAINDKKNNRKYLEKVFERVERVKYSTFLRDQTEKETFKAIVDYIYFLVLYTLENMEEEGTGDLIEKIFNDIK